MVSLVAVLAACHGATDTAGAVAEGPVVATSVIEAATWRPTVEISGTLEPVAAVQLGFEAGGRLGALRVSRGAWVAAGDELATLDRAIANAQLDQAVAAVAAANAQLAAAERSWSRLEQVGDAVSEQARTEALAGRDLARAGAEQARAAQRMARTQLGFYTLRAPFAGVVTAAPDNPGGLVGAGTPLFVIEDVSGLRLKGTAPESETWLVSGLDAFVYPATPGSREGTPGTVERVVPSLDAATRRLPVEVRVANPPAALRAHGLARAVISAAEDEAVWSIPRGALVARPEFSVLVLGEGSEKPTRVRVTVLAERDGRVLLRGDLSAGTMVVVDPPHGYGE